MAMQIDTPPSVAYADLPPEEFDADVDMDGVGSGGPAAETSDAFPSVTSFFTATSKGKQKQQNGGVDREAVREGLPW
jgi:hypothetical protein